MKFARLSFVFATVFIVCFQSGSILAVKTLTWTGCNSSKNAYAAPLARSFEKKYGIHIDIREGDPVRGIRDVASGVADLGGTCRLPFANNDKEKKVGTMPVAWNPLVIIVNKSNPINNISLEDLKKIYEGKIRNWSELGTMDAPVKLFTRNQSVPGLATVLKKLLFNDAKKVSPATRIFLNSESLENAIVTANNAISITNLSTAQTKDLKILSLDGFAPTLDNVKHGDYALFIPLYITFNPRSPKINEVKQFIKYSRSPEAAKIIKSSGAIPYKEAHMLELKMRKKKS